MIPVLQKLNREAKLFDELKINYTEEINNNIFMLNNFAVSNKDNAELKLFMTADNDVRTQRRLDELMSKGEHHTFEDVKRNLEKRDHDDTTRKENPLIKELGSLSFIKFSRSRWV